MHPPIFALHCMKRIRMGFILIVAVFLFAFPVQAQDQTPIGNQVDGYAVVLDGEELFRVRQAIPNVATAAERADVINDRLFKLANNSAIELDSIRVADQSGLSVVLAGDSVLFTVSDADQQNGKSRQVLAEEASQTIRSAVTDYRAERSTEQIVRGILLAILSTIILIVFLALLQRLVSRFLIRLQAVRRDDRLDLRIQNFQILDSIATTFVLSILLKLVRLVLVLSCLYIYIPFLLSQFPATQALGNSIFKDIAYRASQLIHALVSYLPNLVMLGIIAVITSYLIQFAKLVITEFGRNDVYPWFYPEWIQPTNRLATFLLIAIAVVIAAPYLPGFGSPAFQGISLFLGALFTLGSSSAVANAIAGIILIYTRSFQIGDIIRIGETTGEVIEKSLYVTRILTFKKEMITVPNAAVLSGSVVNFNAILRESQGYLVLHTTITLGYDVPWRKIHDTLIAAAGATSGIIASPSPFVLQTALNDFNVSYELNAYTDRPSLMPRIYSELHQNIQDYCNQAGIEILSPGYTSLRDGNHSTIPADYLPDNYNSPAFQVRYPDRQ